MHFFLRKKHKFEAKKIKSLFCFCAQIYVLHKKTFACKKDFFVYNVVQDEFSPKKFKNYKQFCYVNTILILYLFYAKIKMNL